MYSIVSIDFDIIMAPSIELYNNIVGPNRWEEDFMNNPQLALSQADLTHYQKLTQWLIKTIPQMNFQDIHFIQDHEQIINFCDKECALTNIDHHHDIVYNKDEAEIILSCEQLNCGNWVKYLFEQNKIKYYHWINNSNSTPLIEEAPKNILTSSFNLIDFDLNNLGVPDKLIICLSPLWVPPNYRSLFYTWMDICNFIQNRHYNIEG